MQVTLVGVIAASLVKHVFTYPVVAIIYVHLIVWHTLLNKLLISRTSGLVCQSSSMGLFVETASDGLFLSFKQHFSEQ